MCLKFSSFTETHGFSLSTIYRVVKERDPECKIPVLICIRDVSNARFGAYLSEGPKLSDKAFGCGETFVFSLTDQQIYKWNGESKGIFIHCTQDDLSVGGAEGKFAIFLDSNLNQGRSQACQTFKNLPLTPKEDFIASHVELWTFR